MAKLMVHSMNWMANKGCLAGLVVFFCLRFACSKYSPNGDESHGIPIRKEKHQLNKHKSQVVYCSRIPAKPL